MRRAGVEAVIADHWAYGGEGAADACRDRRQGDRARQAEFQLLYPDEMPLRDKIKTIAQKIYRARDIACDGAVESRLAELQKGGFGHFPICIAKTQYSFTTDANAKGAPTTMCSACARSGCRPAPSSSSRSAARS